MQTFLYIKYYLIVINRPILSVTELVLKITKYGLIIVLLEYWDVLGHYWNDNECVNNCTDIASTWWRDIIGYIP